MTNLAKQITELERTRELINKGIANLREAEGGGTAAAPNSVRPAAAPATGRAPLSVQARKRIAAAQKKRWAAVRAKSGSTNGAPRTGVTKRAPAKARTMRARGGA